MESSTSCSEAKRAAKLAYHRAYNKAWYAKNRERRRVQMRAWLEANETAYSEKQKAYRDTRAAKDKRNAAKSRYSKTERGLLVGRAKSAKRRATERDRLIRSIDYGQILVSRGNVCGICGKRIVGKVEFDHIVALARGGAHVAENIQPAHPECNRRKGGYEAHERRQWLF